ncbi:putative membrane protein insertion efficiency factor [Azospirillum lipoferum]|uniref:Putative membrane protein insertion efficiency factor n=1 Tax=Azospirillum lipoferum TaxID=193 RepID=A0A5A9GEJ3_AZOLI|nr:MULTISPECIES: membrane protein insertion efficiency factor YidD [Azospirillum]KAA0591729.1 membrane protein insertion efficiency factor YidD [Azospirillum lipoferum]MCP1614881.1 putative membrane protein insertion efficiency factor [Azospirillum lipoferum]MDW5536368.1 membrane protein insertion efficiency factor YidD [Azospirillum sp. NL1]
MFRIAGLSPLAHLLRALVYLYRWTLSPFVGWQCRFQPTCSCYAIESLEKHGAIRGGWLTVRRLGRCHPWGGAGWDPVPDPGAPQARMMPHRCGPREKGHAAVAQPGENP